VAQLSRSTKPKRVAAHTQVHLVRTHLRVSAEQRFKDYRRIGEAVLEGDETGGRDSGATAYSSQHDAAR
jgi:hypothetical protein